MSLKVLLGVVVFNYLFVAQIEAECIIELTKNVSQRPKLFSDVETATKMIAVPNEESIVVMGNGETIIVYCPNQFANLEPDEFLIKLGCDGDRIMNKVAYGEYYPRGSLLLECGLVKADGTCSIQWNDDKSIKPYIFKKVGTRTTQLSSKMSIFEFKYGQEITVQCDTKFKSPNHQSPTLDLVCIDGRIVTMGHPFKYNYETFECELYKWNLYESKTPFPWCPTSMASYILARPSAHNDYEYLAGICYDFDRMSFKSLYHAATQKNAKHLAPSILETFEPLMEISDIDTNFVSKRTYIYNNQRMLKWLYFSNYGNNSIVQLPRLQNEFFEQFDQLLSIDWWNSLKLGNWEVYQDALANHIDNGDNEYDILAGISNNVAVPISQDECSKTLTMVDVADSKNYKLPLYVWNHVRSLKNSSDEFVVIGVNTPFSDFYDEKELVFCNDICHAIDWLQNAYLTFGYRPMGIIFCCTVEEVLASKRLDGFAVPVVSTISTVPPA